jgi:HEAT repeat protein
MTDVQQLVRQLLEAGAEMPTDVREELVRHGTDAVEPVLRLVEDRSFWSFEAPGKGWAPVHAAEVLCEVADPRVVDPLLEALAESESGDCLHEVLMRSLPKLGENLVESALAAYHDTEDDDYRFVLVVLLSELGVRDRRIFDVLVAGVRRNPDRCADALATYGDEAGLPVLHEVLDSFELRESPNPFANHALIELRAAIESLGGVLTEEQQRKCIAGRKHAEQNMHNLSALFPSPQPVTPVRDPHVPRTEPVGRSKSKLGRNAPCWCGSGKKYKKCHEAQDARGAR